MKRIAGWFVGVAALIVFIVAVIFVLAAVVMQ